MPSIAEVRQQYPQYDDMSDADLAGALHQKFYSDLPRADFDAKIGLQSSAADQPAQAAAPEAAKPEGYDPGALAASVTGGGDMLTLGFGDEIFGAMATPIEMGIGAFTGEDAGKGFGERVSDAYGRGRDKQRGSLDQAYEQHPVASPIGAVGGALAMPGAAAKTVGRAALQGAGMGGAYGFGSGEDGFANRAENAGWGALDGALIGGAVKLGTNAIARRAASKTVPTTDELADASSALYRQAEAANVTVKAPAFQRAIQNVELAGGRINRDLRPKTAGVVEDFKAMAGRDVSLQELDELRQVVNKSLIRAEPQDALTLGRMKEILDNFTDRLGARDITGDIAGLEHIKAARPLWARKSKSELIEGLMEKARDQATGFENGMRIQFRSLLNSPKRLKGFTPDEIKAMRHVVRGGPVENTLRAVGWLDPRGTLGAMMGGLGIGTIGPAGAGALAAAGYGARKGAEAMTRGNVRNVEGVIRSGGKNMTQLALEAARGRGDQRLVESIQKLMRRDTAIRAGAAPLAALAGDRVRN